jgi:crotonobetainyl-CoA:carnitine CoA-transferase CaiB-like acyl-CoA transferase
MEQIFKDLKVIELAGVLVGPAVGYFFAELGAKVIKVENPNTSGDVTRSWKLKREDPKETTSAYFWSVNAFKEFLQLDLAQPNQVETLYDLVKDADIVIVNYKAGDDIKLKVDYATLARLNPKLIYASITGFGQGSTRTAYDLILQAESGFMSMNGETNSKGLKMPVALIDLIAGHQLKEAILIALFKRYKENRGSHVSVSLFDSAIASLANQATNWLVAHELPKPGGSIHPNIAPYGEIFETKDHQLVTFAIGTNKQFKNFCAVIGNNNLSTDAQFANNHHRVTNRQQLYSVLYNYVRKLNFAELSSACLGKDVPFGKIRNLKEVFELPEARSMLRRYTFDNKELQVVSGLAFRFLK